MSEIKKYFEKVLKDVERAINKKDYELAEDLLKYEFENPLMDFETGKIFDAKLKEIELEKEAEYIDKNTADLKTKSDFYAKIFDKKHRFLNEIFLEIFITKFINEFDNIDIAFINSIFSDEDLEISRKIDAFIVLVKNNINIEIDFYNQYYQESKKINPVNFLDEEGEVQLTKNKRYFNTYEYIMKYYEKEPSFLQFAQTFVYAYLFYHFPFEMHINEGVLKSTLVKLIDGFKNQTQLLLNFEEEEIGDQIMSILKTIL